MRERERERERGERESRLRKDSSGSSHTSDLKFGTPVATLPGVWHYRVSAGLCFFQMFGRSPVRPTHLAVSLPTPLLCTCELTGPRQPCTRCVPASPSLPVPTLHEGRTVVI